MGQALAESMREVFLSEVFVEMVQGLPSTEVFVSHIAEGFLKCCADQSSMLTTLTGSMHFTSVAEAWSQIKRFMKALLLALAKAPENTPPTDAFWYSEYTGSNFFDKSVKTLLGKSSWWKAQLADIARVAGARPLLQPKVDR